MKRRGAVAPIEVREYLARAPPEMRAALQQLRRNIRAAAPDAEEVLSYRMPAYRQDGMLVWYAAFKDHCSLFVGSTAVLRRFSAELNSYSTGKGTLRFSPERPIPAFLVRRLVRMRVAENESRASAKLRKAQARLKRPRR